MEQGEAAEAAGVSRVTLSRYENAKQRPPHDVIEALTALYRERATKRGVSWNWGTPSIGNVSRGSRHGDTWEPNPALKNKIPSRAYEAAIAYCKRLALAGVPRENIEEAERLMIDSRYAQANKRNGRELSEDEWILLVDATWEAIREALSWEGVRV